MDDNRPDDATPPDSGRPKRAPPTIDLEASEVTSPDADAGGGKPAGRASLAVVRHNPPVCGRRRQRRDCCRAAGDVVAWAAGWPSEPPRPIAEINTGAIDALSSRVSELEGRSSKPAAPDAALSSRLDALEKSLAGLRTRRRRRPRPVGETRRGVRCGEIGAACVRRAQRLRPI